MDKIYSRKRFLIKPISGNNLPKLPQNKKQKRKIIKIMIIIVAVFLINRLMLRYIEPVFESMCADEAKAVATIISNEQSTIVMNKYQYEDLFTIEKDQNGNIVIIKSNVVPMNNMISDLTGNIQKEFDKTEKTEIKIPMGNLTGGYVFSGMGPDIPVQLAIIGVIETDVRSEFTHKGINQTLHRVYLNLICRMNILTPVKSFEREIINQVIIAEHVIIGNIPDSYYNLEGMESGKDTLEVVN